uniref:ATP synthase F0 subunit 8 n=1 Tax=Panagrolaimus sp. PS1159 TaxID=55785 RepID=A0AC35FZP0_9BILA
MFPFEDAYFSPETQMWPFKTAGSNQFILVFLFLIARMLINIAFYSWLFFIVFRCYKYFTAKNYDVKLPSHQRYF